MSLYLVLSKMRNGVHNKTVMPLIGNMDKSEKYTLIDYAVGTDDGSISLCFKAPDDDDLLVVLDNGIDSQTKGRIYCGPNFGAPISLSLEHELVEVLTEANIDVENDEGTGAKLIDSVLKVINGRKTA